MALRRENQPGLMGREAVKEPATTEQKRAVRAKRGRQTATRMPRGERITNDRKERR
jgi:hypothetical protein